MAIRKYAMLHVKERRIQNKVCAAYCVVYAPNDSDSVYLQGWRGSCLRDGRRHVVVLTDHVGPDGRPNHKLVRVDHQSYENLQNDSCYAMLPGFHLE